MARLFLAVLLILIPVDSSRTQLKQNSANSPIVSISLPANIPSEPVQIRYFLTGSFGGYGSFIEPRPNQRDYEIEASAERKAADSVKILAYATGCKIQTFDLELTRLPNPKVRFVCDEP
jgi:hypothetical protein